MIGLVVVEPNDPCDRCGHPSKRHAGPERESVCEHPRCHPIKRGDPSLCDGFVPARKAAGA